MSVRNKWLWPSRVWRWALFTVATTTVLITGALYKVEINKQVARTYPNVVSPATYLKNNVKKTLMPEYVKGSNTVVTHPSKGGNLMEEDTDKGINIASSVKGSNLMIVSYMRSGSSMNGRVFGENPDNFYVFEPLIKLAPHHYLTEDKLCEVQTNSCRSDPEHNNKLGPTTEEMTNNNGDDTEIDDFNKVTARKLSEAAIRNLKHIYSCNIQNLDDNILRSIIFEWKRHGSKSGESWTNFTTCYIKLVQPNVTDFGRYANTARLNEFEKHKNIFRLLQQPGPKADAFRKCLDKLVSHCRQTKLRVTKVLRISLRFLPFLMNEIPDLKVLSIIRDPRGIINSRIKTHWYPIKDNDSQTVMGNIESLCFKVQEDIEMIGKLKRDFPGRFLDYSLEELVKDPMKNFQTIFKFADLEMTDTYSKKIKEVFTEKPTFLNQWNATLNPKYINWTQRYCHRGWKTYGFEKINF